MTATITDRLNGLTTSVAVKAPCKAVSTTALTLSGEQTVGGVACVDGDRVLYALSGGSVNNGIYVVSTGAWTRAKDFNGSRDVVQGTLVLVVDSGVYEVATAGPIVIGTTTIELQVSVALGNLSTQLADSANASYGAGMIGWDSDTIYTVGAGKKLRQVVHVEDEGAVGDNSTDDEAAILAAITKGVARGVPVVFDGAKTYRVDAATWSIAAGAILQTNGCTFTCPNTTTGDDIWLTVNAGCRIDELKVNIPTAIRRDRAILITGDDTQVGRVVLTSVDQQANSAAADGGVQITAGARMYVGLVRVTNYDRAIIVSTTDKSTILRAEVTSYVRGLYLVDNENLQINGGLIKTASANASATAGHNGVLMGCTATDAQRDVTLTNIVVENAGEHGFRLGGPEQHSNIRFSYCSAYDIGGCGIKVHGTDSGSPSSTNRNIVIDHFIAEDVGTDAGLAAQNRAGLLIKFCNGAQVVAPIVRLRNDAVSSSYGMVINGSSNVMVTTPFILGATNAGIYLQAADGDNTAISISGGLCRDNGGDGMRVYTATGKTSARVTVEGVNLESNTSYGLEIDNDGTMTACFFNAHTYANTAGGCVSNSTSTKLQLSSTAAEITAAPLSGVSAVNGSWYDDSATLNIRKAGAWAAL